MLMVEHDECYVFYELWTGWMLWIKCIDSVVDCMHYASVYVFIFNAILCWCPWGSFPHLYDSSSVVVVSSQTGGGVTVFLFYCYESHLKSLLPFQRYQNTSDLNLLRWILRWGWGPTRHSTLHGNSPLLLGFFAQNLSSIRLSTMSQIISSQILSIIDGYCQ